jgi:hypothetical protein
MFTKREIEVIKRLGKPRPILFDDQQPPMEAAAQIAFEMSVHQKYLSWLRNQIADLNAVDTVIDAIGQSEWTESAEVLDRLKRLDNK